MIIIIAIKVEREIFKKAKKLSGSLILTTRDLKIIKYIRERKRRFQVLFMFIVYMLGILNSVLIDGIFMFPIGLFLNGVFMWYVEVFSAWIRVGIMNKFYPFADEIDIYINTFMIINAS